MTRSPYLTCFLCVALSILSLVTFTLSAGAQNQTCDVDGNSMCRHTNVGAIHFRYFFAYAGDTIDVRTHSLSGDSAYWPADSEVIVLKLTGAGEYDVVGFDDDGNTSTPDIYDSHVTVTAPNTTYYYAVVTSRHSLYSGSGVLEIRRNGALTGGTPTTAEFGSASRIIGFREGDGLRLTKSRLTPSGTNPSYQDTRLLALEKQLEGTCTSGCGNAAYNDNDLSLLSSIDAPFGADPQAGGRVYVGSAVGASSMHTRLYHLRRHTSQGGNWTEWVKRDADGDGLPAELEEVLGTCEDWTSAYLSGESAEYWGDLHVKTGVTDCLGMRNFINDGQSCGSSLIGSHEGTCWSALDSDQDGLTDYEELYGIRRCYPQSPEPLIGWVPFAIDADADDWFDNDCNTAATYELALSALDSTWGPGDDVAWEPPDPRYHDTLVDLIYYKNYNGSTPDPTTMARDNAPNDIALGQWFYSWEEEPTECDACAPSTCDTCVAAGSATTSFCETASCCDDPATDCPTDDRYGPRLHVFAAPYQVEYDHADSETSNVGGSRGIATRLNMNMMPQRRYTHAFKFFGLSEGSGGQAVTGSKFAVVGAQTRMDATVGRDLTHEGGHTSNVEHGGDVEGPSINLAYPSLMSYGYARAPLKRPSWDGTMPDCSASACSNWADCVDTTRDDAGGNDIMVCVPRNVPPDWQTDLWPFRFSRNISDFGFIEDQFWEGSVPRRWLPFYAGSADSDATLTERFLSFDGQGGYSSAVWNCSSNDCGLDIDDNGFLQLTSWDMNEDGTIDASFDFDDFDDWGQMIRSSRIDLAKTTAANFHVAYFSGFNAPLALRDASGGCDATCEAQVRPYNVFGWQPSWTHGGAVSYEDEQNGRFGYMPRFYGNNSPSWIRLDSDPRFDLLNDQSRSTGDFDRFRIWAWIQLEDGAPTQYYHPVAESDIFQLTTYRFGSTSTYVGARVKLADGSWTSWRWIGPVSWPDGEQRRVAMTWHHGNNQLTTQISEGIAYNPGGPLSRDSVGIATDGTWTFSQPLSSDSFGDIYLGRATSLQGLGSEYLDGYLDDFVMRRGGGTP